MHQFTDDALSGGRYPSGVQEESMIYLLTRPITWLVAIVLMIVRAPFKAVSHRRNRRARKEAHFAAQTIREQQKAARNPAA